MDLKGIDEKVVDKVGEEGYFTRDKVQNKKGEDQFFAQGEKPEVMGNYIANLQREKFLFADLIVASEKEDYLRSRQRPKSCRPCLIDEHQERAIFDRVLREFV